MFAPSTVISGPRRTKKAGEAPAVHIDGATRG
jgi:hypothetical protein